GNDLYNVDFSFPPENWPLGKKQRFEAVYDRKAGTYQLKKTVPGERIAPHVDIPLRDPVDNFAFEVNAQVNSTEPNDGSGFTVWSASQAGREPRYLLRVQHTKNGELHLSSHTPDRDKPSVTPDTNIPHTLIKRKDQFNRVLIIVREGYLEIYANGFAVCNPL